jgi:hypothetical protein
MVGGFRRRPAMLTRTATRRRLRRVGLLLVALAALALPLRALAGEQVPYKGSDSGHWTLEGNCPQGIVPVDINGVGTATHVGRYIYHAAECFDPVASTVTGTFTVTAASGDTIFGSYSGPCGVDTCTETAAVEGGTGRFAGAQGQLEITVLVGPGTYSEKASGTVSSPGAAG